MKKTRKLLSIILCLALTLCLALPALAAPTTYTLTINSKTPHHDYEAYQIFAGELKQSPTNPGVNTLVDIEWGNGVQDPVALLTAIQGITIDGERPFESCQNPDDVANKLATFKDNAAELDAFAAVVAGHLSATKYIGSTDTDVDGNETYTAKIQNLLAGYYLVKEADFTGDEGDNNAYTKFILEIVKDATVEAKADVPTLEKKVSDTADGTYGDAAAASVGSKVYFKITSKVPDMDGYNKYYFIVNDTLSKGLTYNRDIAITIGGTPLDLGTDFTVTPTGGGPNNSTQLEIVFDNFIQYKTSSGAAIEIIYSATVNEYAEIGTTGNLNTANLEYSNNPNVEYEGDNEPKPEEPTGETPDDITAVYVTAIQIHKVDTSGNALKGAEFTLTGESVIKTGVTQFNNFVVDDNGSYYLLKDGKTYTQTAPTPDTEDNYLNPDTKYSPAGPVTVWDEITEDKTVTGTVGETGVLKFAGLGAGTYTIKETKAPENYNKIDDITVNITCKLPEKIDTGNEPCTWKYQIGSEEVKEAANGIIPLTIQNRSGAELPSTGGIGTTIFVYGGIILMVLALGVVAVRTYSRKKNA